MNVQTTEEVCTHTAEPEATTEEGRQRTGEGGEEQGATRQEAVTTTGIGSLDEMIGSMCIADHAAVLGCMRLAALDPALGKRIEAVVADEIDTTLAGGNLDYECDKAPMERWRAFVDAYEARGAKAGERVAQAEDVTPDGL